MSARKPWKKILYEQQGYADNFNGPQFLQEMKKNVTAETYELWQAIGGSCVLMLQIDVVVLFAVIFAFVDTDVIGWQWLLAICFTLAVLGYVVLLYLSSPANRLDLIKDNLKTLIVFFAFGYGLSPVFRTLTETISTDTIYAMSTCMFLLSIAFHDYSVDAPIVSSSFSLNLAIFGAVCLISRLPSSNHAFAVLTLAVQLFAQWPLVRGRLVALDSRLNAAMMFVVAGVTIAGCGALSLVAAALHILLHVFICIVCPWWLIWMQPLKSTIHGPWDEAIIKDS
uniref:Phosphatidylinositol N-acetylglucosaminyltransferase subunit C n=1 Tax=Plectus sambesii TaxID=2011161 RepID=A0A914VA35_9BILA